MTKIIDNKQTISRIVLAIIIIITIVIGGYLGYKFYMTKTNTEKFINYLTSTGYVKKEGDLYIKNSGDVTYYFLKNDNAISKIFLINDDNMLYNYSIDPINNTYELTLELKGSSDGEYGLSEQKMIYDKKTTEYTCKVISNQGLPVFCKEMKVQLVKYQKEIQELIKQSGANEKFILNK